ncbi:hypothetical protein GCM10027589_30640 [Actinocorallia lasiicapitis]
MDGGPHLRIMRSAVFAGLAVALSAGGRQAVTGTPLPVATVLLAFAAVFAVALAVSAGERGFVPIAAALVPLGLLLNALFNAGQRGCPPGMGNLICGGGTARPSVEGPIGAHGLVDLAGAQLVLLVAVNLLALLILALWLRQGEAAVFTLLRTVALMLWTGCAAVLAWLTVRPGTTPPVWAPPPGEPAALRAQDALLTASPRRGPPLAVPA